MPAASAGARRGDCSLLDNDGLVQQSEMPLGPLGATMGVGVSFGAEQDRFLSRGAAGAPVRQPTAPCRRTAADGRVPDERPGQAGALQ